MTTNAGPGSLASTSVLHYDVHNQQKSYFGPEIVNQFALPTPDASGNVTFAVQGTGTFQRIYSGKYGHYDIKPTDVVYKYVLGTVGCHYHGNSVAISAGTYVTWQFDYYVDPSSANFPTVNFLANLENYGGGGLSGGITLPNNSMGIWQTVTATFGPTASSGTQAMFLYPGACSNSYLASSGFILYKNPMVTFTTYSPTSAFTYTSGTRSNTQNLVDISGGNNTIPTTSLTYAADGSFSFNGTSNKMYQTTIPASYATVSNSLSRSWEVVAKPTATITTAAIYGHKTGAGCSYFCNGGIYISSGYWTFNWYDNANYQFLSSGITSTANTYYHIVCTYDSTDQKPRIYINGTLAATYSTATNMNYNTTINEASIGWNSKNDYGGGGASDYFTGLIPVVRYYSGKALTAAEVNQNFNALRGRYGI